MVPRKQYQVFICLRQRICGPKRFQLQVAPFVVVIYEVYTSINEFIANTGSCEIEKLLKTDTSSRAWWCDNSLARCRNRVGFQNCLQIITGSKAAGSQPTKHARKATPAVVYIL